MSSKYGESYGDDIAKASEHLAGVTGTLKNGIEAILNNQVELKAQLAAALAAGSTVPGGVQTQVENLDTQLDNLIDATGKLDEVAAMLTAAQTTSPADPAPVPEPPTTPPAPPVDGGSTPDGGSFETGPGNSTPAAPPFQTTETGTVENEGQGDNSQG